MKAFYTVLILGLLFFKNTNAQIVTGTITDASSKEALIGVNIVLQNGTGTSTDINGKYQLKTEEGDQEITFKYIGYDNVSKIISIQKSESKTIDITLSPSSEELSTVVISAGRFEQKIEDITVSMEVIKPSLIENKNTTDIQTAMDQIPGVNITDGQANIRGGSGWSFGAGTRVLVMVDDMPLISGDAGQVQWSLIATENINQVEVIKGAASALYGSSALNGIINIRTAFPSQKDIEKNPLKKGYLKVNMHSGVYDFPEREVLNWNGDKRRAFKGYEFLFSNKYNNLDLSIGGNIFKDDGFREGEKTDRKRFNLNSTYKSKKIEGLSYGLNTNFLLQESGSAIIWNGFDKAYIPLNDEITKTKSETYNIDPFITYIKGTNHHSFRTRYLKVRYDNSTQDLNLSNAKEIDSGQDNESETYYSDYQWQKNIKAYNLRITTGTTNEIVYARSDLFSGNNTRENHSLYTQVNKKIGRLNLAFGARYENFKITSEEKYVVDGDSLNSFEASKPVFRTGINYQVAEATYLRASFGEGFRFPSMAELFISTNQAGLEIYPNPGLKPESGWSSELAIKQGIKINKWMGYLDIAAFIMQYDDMMEFSFGGWGNPLTDPLFGLGFKSINVGKTQISGVELSVTGQGKINNNLTINLLAGYTYMDPVSLEPNRIYETTFQGGEITYTNSSSDPTILKYRYKNIAKTDVEIMYKRLSVGSSFRYNDFMANIDSIFVTDFVNENLVPGINQARKQYHDGDFIIDLRFGYQANEIMRFGIIINNLLNREYMTRPATMMSPRTFAIQYSLKI